MKINENFSFFIACLFCFITYAQADFIDYDDIQSYQITQNSDVEIINAFLKKHNATEIEFNPNPNSSYPFRLQNKKGNWMLFTDQWSDNQFIMTREAKRYSFQLPSAAEEQMLITWAKRNGYTYWVNLSDENIEKRMAFDDVNVSTKKVKRNLGNIQYEEEIIDKIAVKVNDKWGLIEPGGNLVKPFFYISRNFLYNSAEEVPPPTGFEIGQLEMIEYIRKRFSADKIDALDDYGYYLQARKNRNMKYGFFLYALNFFESKNENEELFGLFHGEAYIDKFIPIEYNHIQMHNNFEIFEVWKNGKVGYYNSAFKLVKEPVFDAFHLIHLDYMYACALQKDGFWQLFDAFDGSLVVEAKAETIEELQALWSKP